MATREGFTHLIVESDSTILIDVVIGSCKLNEHNHILVCGSRYLTCKYCF